MNRSKIFLAATTALLAMVGFISAKAHKAFGPITYYTATSDCTKSGVSNDAHTALSGTDVLGVTQYNTGCNGKLVIPGEQ